MSTSLFTNLQGSSIPSTTDSVRSSGYRTIGKGAADYARASTALAATLPSSGQNIWWFAAADGSKFYLSTGQDLYIEMFGAYGDYVVGSGGTDDFPAWQAAVDYLSFFKQSVEHPWYNGLLPLHFTSARYLMSDTLDCAAGTFTLIGPNRGAPYGGHGAIIYTAAGKTGILVSAHNTSGLTGTKADGNPTGIGTTITGLHFNSLGNGTGSNAWQQDGARIRAFATLRDCTFSGFSRHGVNITASSGGGGAVEGNANTFALERVFAIGNRQCGIFVDGADANAGYGLACNASNNGTWGIKDSSFLGNSWIACHASDNGNKDLAAGWVPTADRVGAMTRSGGIVYYVKNGQAALAKTYQPGVTAGWQNVWGVIGAQNAHPYWPEWVDETAFVDGGPYCTEDLNAASVFIGCYAEGAQPPSQISQRSMVIGGLHGPGVTDAGASGKGPYLRANGGGALVADSFISSAVDPSSNKAVTVSFGNAFNHAVFDIFDEQYLGQYNWSLQVRDGGTLRWSHANLDNRVPLEFTGETTTRTFGRSATVPFITAVGVLGLGFGSNGRLLGFNGAHFGNGAASGETVFNSFASTAQVRGWQCVSGGTTSVWEPILREIAGSAAYDPPSIAAGASTTTTITVTGAAVGDMAVAAFSGNVHPIVISAYVSAANVVTVVLSNPSASAQDLGSGTLFAKVTKQ
ncbi:MAG: hypothetical protein ACJ8ER_09790 [Allosphingosinicella sp.]